MGSFLECDLNRLEQPQAARLEALNGLIMLRIALCHRARPGLLTRQGCRASTDSKPAAGPQEAGREANAAAGTRACIYVNLTPFMRVQMHTFSWVT